jgi:hypothetical protein
MPLRYSPPLLDISPLFMVIVLVKDCLEILLAFEYLRPFSEDELFFDPITSISYFRLIFLGLRLSRSLSEKVEPSHRWPEA